MQIIFYTIQILKIKVGFFSKSGRLIPTVLEQMLPCKGSQNHARRTVKHSHFSWIGKWMGIFHNILTHLIFLATNDDHKLATRIIWLRAQYWKMLFWIAAFYLELDDAAITVVVIIFVQMSFGYLREIKRFEHGPDGTNFKHWACWLSEKWNCLKKEQSKRKGSLVSDMIYEFKTEATILEKWRMKILNRNRTRIGSKKII